LRNFLLPVQIDECDSIITLQQVKNLIFETSGVHAAADLQWSLADARGLSRKLHRACDFLLGSEPMYQTTRDLSGGAFLALAPRSALHPDFGHRCGDLLALAERSLAFVRAAAKALGDDFVTAGLAFDSEAIAARLHRATIEPCVRRLARLALTVRESACIEGVAATRRTKAAVSVAVRTTTSETELALVPGLWTIGEQILLDCVRDGFGTHYAGFL
jgi:hypothetical protein